MVRSTPGGLDDARPWRAGPRSGSRPRGTPRAVSWLRISHTSLRELRVRVDAGADRRAADRQLAQGDELLHDPPVGVGDLAGVAAELLAEADRRGVHQVRAADLDDVVELRRPWPSSAACSLCSAGIRSPCRASTTATCIAVGITSLDDWPMLTWSLGWMRHPALRSPRSLVPPWLVLPSCIARLRDDLVGVHVRARARAGLENVEHEMVVEPAVDDLAGGLLDQRRRACGSSLPSRLLASAAACLISPRARMNRRPKR